MKVKMKVEISGTRDGENWPKRGGIIDVPADEAAQLIANGQAVDPKDDADAEVETAAADDSEVETATTAKKAAKKAPAKPAAENG